MAGKLVASLFVRATCAFIFIGMAVPKTKSPEWLSLMGITWLPSELASLVGLLLPWFEISLGLLLLIPSVWRSAARIASALLLSFIPVLVAFALEGRPDCGCSSGSNLLPPWANTPAFGIIRNLVMAGSLWAVSRWNHSGKAKI
jgi:hypothetical protein